MTRPRYYVLDEAGDPSPVADVLTWAQWFETAEIGVAFDAVGEVSVSTVFLGADHLFNEGPPALWETMILGGPFDLSSRRYTSRESAIAGHLSTVARVVGADLDPGDRPNRVK